jgi:hypothetical protein
MKTRPVVESTFFESESQTLGSEFKSKSHKKRDSTRTRVRVLYTSLLITIVRVKVKRMREIFRNMLKFIEIYEKNELLTVEAIFIHIMIFRQHPGSRK